MEHNCIYQFFNNASIAAVLSITVGFFLAKYIYREQKKIDRKISNEEKFVEVLMLLKEHCRAVNQVIDRLSNTYKTILENGNEDARQRFFTISVPEEIIIAGDVLMYKIPEDISKIDSIMLIYYSDDAVIKDSIQKVFDALTKWHDFVQLHAMGKSGKKFDLTKRVSEVPEFSLDKLDEAIQELITDLKK